jgi:hypothetical protein
MSEMREGILTHIPQTEEVRPRLAGKVGFENLSALCSVTAFETGLVLVERKYRRRTMKHCVRRVPASHTYDDRIRTRLMHSICQHLSCSFFPIDKQPSLFRYRIVSAGIPRMTPQNPSECEPRTSYDSETIDRFVTVLAAARVKATEPLPEYRSDEPVIQRQGLLVDADDREEDSLEHAR